MEGKERTVLMQKPWIGGVTQGIDGARAVKLGLKIRDIACAKAQGLSQTVDDSDLMPPQRPLGFGNTLIRGEAMCNKFAAHIA